MAIDSAACRNPCLAHLQLRETELRFRNDHRMKPKTIAALFGGFVMLVIMIQNTQEVAVHILFWKIILPQIFLIFLVLLAGFGLGYLFGSLKKNLRER